jgi:CRP/FNR family transcriptional regulator, anaerobic regulatory protein
MSPEQSPLAWPIPIPPPSAGLLEHLWKTMRVKRIPRRRFLLEEDEVSNKIWLLERGLVRCYYSRGDREVTTWFLEGVNIIVAMKSFCEQRRSKFYIQALDDCETRYLEQAEVQYILSRFPEAKDMRITISEQYTNLLAMRIRAISMQSPVLRYQYMLRHFPYLQGRIPLDIMASFLDMDRRTLTKLRSRYKNK